MAQSRKQQGKYRKIIKDDNPDSSYSSVPSVFPSSSIHSTSFLSTSLPSTPISSSSTLSSTSSTSVIPMTKDQFNEFINK